MPITCPKCNTVYHTDEEWRVHRGGNCAPHSMEHEISEHSQREQMWNILERVSVIDPEVQSIIREFRQAQTIEGKNHARNKLAKYIQDKRDRL